MSTPRPGGRYQVKESLGQGGMGDVYLALDMKSDPPREVALKTIRGTGDPAAVELFKRECSVLMSFNHPNVIELYDSGDFEDRGVSKPFFVMARLRGVTLAQLIKDSPQHLTVERTVEILYQVCRGLQAAHEHDLVHRDIKPSNIFVLEDDSVKVIDFGVAHLVTSQTLGAKGTLFYMAPEQIEGRLVTPATDIFSLGVVCFEALTRKKPFLGNTADEIRTAVTKRIPPPASSLNPAVSNALSQVIHAAMAKKPLHRFTSAREFGECLKKALRNEPIERFEPDKLQVRLLRVERALEASQYEIANDILAQLEEEGYLHASIEELRRQVDQALRNRDIRQFLDTAGRFLAQEEYILALQKVHDAMQLDPINTETLALRTEIESKRSTQQIGNWLKLAHEHLGNYAFEPAREAVESVLRMAPTDATALRLKGEINRVEQDIIRKRGEKERSYESAIEFHHKGDLTAALSRLERVLKLDREAPDGLKPERAAAYQKFYNDVRSEAENIRNSLEEARSKLEARDYSAAEAICDAFLIKYPTHALFQALKYDIGDRQRQDLSAYIAEVDRKTEAEPDLERKAKLLEEALSRCPGEVHFERALKGVSAKRDLIDGLENLARNLETRGLYSEAIDKWEMLRAIYKQYPGLDIEVDRLRKRLEQHTRSEAKARWIDRIDSTLNSGECARALDLVQQALLEFPGEAQLIPLERLARQRVEQSLRAQDLLERGQKLLEDEFHDSALQLLEEAHALDPHNALIRAVYIEAMLRKASANINSDPDAADQLIDAAYGLDATNPRVKSMRVLTTDRKRSLAVDQYLSKARELQAADELELASIEVEKGLAAHPDEAQLRQLQAVLKTMVDESQKQSELRRDRGKMVELRRGLEQSKDSVFAQSVFEESVVLANKHRDDEQIQVIATEIDRQVHHRRPETEPNHADSGPDVEQKATEKVQPSTIVGNWRLKLARLKPQVTLYRRRSLTALVVLIAFGISSFILLRKEPPPPPATASGPVRVRIPLKITPPESRVQIGPQDYGNSRELLLETGLHRITISAPGYRDETVYVNVTETGTIVKPVVLSILPTVVEVDSGSATVKLNGQILNDVDPRQELVASEQEQLVEISNTLNQKGQFSFISTAAALPRIARPPNWQNTFVAALIVSFGDRSRVYGPKKLKFDGGDEQEVPADGLEFSGLGETSHEITFGTRDQPYSLSIQRRDSPTVTLMIPDPDQGRIRITSDQTEVEVWVRGSTEKVETRRGLQFSVKPGDYFIRGAKVGYSDSGPHKVTVKAGKVQPVSLAFVSRYATLFVTDLPQDAEVFFKSNKLSGDFVEGSFRIDKVDPGSGELSVKLDRLVTVPRSVSLAAGETLRLRWAEFVKQWLVAVSCSVPGCEISYIQGQSGAVRIAAGQQVLGEGSYVFTGSAPEYISDTKNLRIPGEQQTVELRPARPAPVMQPPPGPLTTVLPPAAPKRLSNSDFRPVCKTTSESKGFLECKDGASLSAGFGTHSFEVTLPNGLLGLGGKSAKWTVDFGGNRRVEFTLNDESLIAEPKNMPGMKLKTEMKFSGKSSFYVVEILISGGTIEHRIKAERNPQAAAHFQRFQIPPASEPSEFKFRGDNLVRSFSFTGTK